LIVIVNLKTKGSECDSWPSLFYLEKKRGLPWPPPPPQANINSKSKW
jgi:hypothetical protein